MNNKLLPFPFAFVLTDRSVFSLFIIFKFLLFSLLICLTLPNHYLLSDFFLILEDRERILWFELEEKDQISFTYVFVFRE